MGSPGKDQKLAADLANMLAPAFEGIAIEVMRSKRWDRDCVIFRWSGFARLLPEERFHRLVQAIPEDFRKARLARLVWLELAPKESVDAYLKLPRSEDVADRETSIYARLAKARFFEALGKSLGPAPDKNCPGDLSKTAAVLRKKKWTAPRIRDAKLVFIRHGVFCDCQVLQTAQPTLVKAYGTGA